MNQFILLISERILAFAILFQTIEMLQMKSAWSEVGVWRWSTLKKEYEGYPGVLKVFFDLAFSEKGFTSLLVLRLLLSGLTLFYSPQVYAVAFLFLSTWLIAIRWRGIFNGGSDSMTALIAFALSVAQFFSDQPLVLKTAFAYIAVQVSLSYFIAGWVKLKNPEWRSGVALPIFIQTPRYDSPPVWFQKLLNQPIWAKWISRAVIVFDFSFPLAWFSPTICLIYLFLAFCFHLLNFWIFGLNRFVFSWMAGYPALYYWSGKGFQ